MPRKAPFLFLHLAPPNPPLYKEKRRFAVQLGLTIPLQRYLRAPRPPAPPAAERLFCWDLHRILLRGEGSLLAVHCASRFAVVVFGLSAVDWASLDGVVPAQICRGLLDADLPQAPVRAYLERCGPPCFTRTHGRREVAFLNRAWEDVMACDFALDRALPGQPLLERAVNALPRRCAGQEGLASSRERLLQLLV